MSPPVRIGIVGLNWGRRHLKAFDALADAAVVAIADTDPGTLDQAAAGRPTCRAYPDAAALIAAGGLDAVVIATPTSLHERQAIQAFDSDLHALCESPIGIDGREASHIVTAAGLAGKAFMWSNPLRYLPSIAATRKRIEAGELGDALHAVAARRLPGWTHPPESWRLDRERGGGALLAVAAQTLDAVWFAMGCPDPIEALASRFDRFAARHARQLDSVAEDLLAGMVRFKNGATLQCFAQLNADSDSGLAEREGRIWGSAGFAELSFGSEAELAVAFAAQAAAFVEAVSGRSDPAATGKQALSLAKMTDGLALSAKEKEAVSIKVERTLDDLFGGL